MKIFIEGIYIPNTNEWWIDETWKIDDLITDVIKIATEKTHDPNNYDMYVYSGPNDTLGNKETSTEFKTFPRDSIISEILPDCSYVQIRLKT